jgi:hypothetical protein
MADETADINVTEFTKNSRETVRVGLSEFKGHKLLQIRAWVSRDDGTAIPTRAGIALRVELIADLRAALDQVERKARELGWLREGGA